MSIMIRFYFILLFMGYAKLEKFSSIVCNQRNPKIVGGVEAREHEMPFIVSLMRRGGHFCGASVIHKRWILTAGHCTCNGFNKFMKPTEFQAILGLHNISEYRKKLAEVKSNTHPIQVTLKSIIPHPEYQCENVQHDIALLEVKNSIEFSSFIQPTCLHVDFNLKNFANEFATTYGWGWTHENQENGQGADILRKASVKIWTNNACQKSYQANGKPNSFITDNILCAGIESGGVDSCWADSGGPLVSKENKLVGIVSTGIGCARPGLPGIYTRVSKYIHWIESVVLDLKVDR